MHHSDLVHRLERTRDLANDAHRRIHGEAVVLQELSERRSGQKLHHIGDSSRFLGLDEVRDVDDRRVAYAVDDLRLLQEAGNILATCGQIVGQHLDRDLARQPLMASLVDRAHSAPAELALEQISLENFSRSVDGLGGHAGGQHRRAGGPAQVSRPTRTYPAQTSGRRTFSRRRTLKAHEASFEPDLPLVPSPLRPRRLWRR